MKQLFSEGIPSCMGTPKNVVPNASCMGKWDLKNSASQDAVRIGEARDVWDTKKGAALNREIASQRYWNRPVPPQPLSQVGLRSSAVNSWKNWRS